MSHTGQPFVLTKGGEFNIAKNNANFHVGVRWARNGIDVDLHLLGVEYENGDSNSPVLYGGGTHALSYFNTQYFLKKAHDGGYETSDQSMWWQFDNRRGGAAAGSPGEDHHAHAHEDEEPMSEQAIILTPKLPVIMPQIDLWLTIHEATKRKHDFSMVNELVLDVCDLEDEPMFLMYPQSETPKATAIQVGSFMRDPDSGLWKFVAVSAGSIKSYAEVLRAYGAVVQE